jgi:hypothetical protein
MKEENSYEQNTLENWEKERVFIHPLIGARNQKVTITNCGSGYTHYSFSYTQHYL